MDRPINKRLEITFVCEVGKVDKEIKILQHLWLILYYQMRSQISVINIEIKVKLNGFIQITISCNIFLQILHFFVISNINSYTKKDFILY